jgi:hypothetical protein
VTPSCGLEELIVCSMHARELDSVHVSTVHCARPNGTLCTYVYPCKYTRVDSCAVHARRVTHLVSQVKADVVLYDLPPALGVTTELTLMHCDYFIVPCEINKLCEKNVASIPDIFKKWYHDACCLPVCARFDNVRRHSSALSTSFAQQCQRFPHSLPHASCSSRPNAAHSFVPPAATPVLCRT